MSIRLFISAVLAAFALNAAAVDANTASLADLETVKGVGPGLAGKIVDTRKSAPFKDWNDMVERVGGIGPGNAARFSQAGMTVSGTAYPGAATKPAREAQRKPGKAADPMADKTAAKTAERKTEKKADKPAPQ